MGKVVTHLLLLIAVICWMVSWGRLVSAAATNVPPWQLMSYLPEGAVPDSAMTCGRQVIAESGAIWRFPCMFQMAESEAQAVALVRFDMTGAGQHQSWIIPDATATGLEDNPYRLFTFVPNSLSGHVVFGVIQPSGEGETAPALYLARLDGGLVMLNPPTFTDYTQVRGAAWIDELNLQVVYGDFYDEEVSLAALFGMGGDEEGGEGESTGDETAPPDAEADALEQTPTVTATEAAESEGETEAADDEAAETPPSDAGDDESESNGEASGEGEDAGEGGDGDDGGDGFFLPPLLMPRATLHIASWSGRTGEWATRDIADPACSEDYTACIPELAYHTSDGWRMVYLRYPATVRNVTGVTAEIVEGTETEPPFKTGEVSLFDTTHCFMTGGFENPLFQWISKPLDFSRSNVLFREACLPLYRLNDQTWEVLSLPESDEGISYDIPTTDAYYYSADVGYLEALTVANALRDAERLIYLDGRWLSLSTDDSGITLTLSDADNAQIVVNALRTDWLSWLNTPVAPDGEGGLWLHNERMDYAHVNVAFERLDTVPLETRISRMLNDNFRLMAGTQTIYGDENVLKRLAAPWLLVGLPILLVAAALIWRSRKLPVRFYDSVPALVAALVYIASFAAFVTWFWSMTALL